jgi:hypothetical protein
MDWYRSSLNPYSFYNMTFSSYYEHGNPLFIKLEILKLHDLVIYHNALFMYDFHIDNLPDTFNTNHTHNYNTRLASRSSHSLPRIRTNYGKFSIRYSGSKLWNHVDDETKKLKPSQFKKNYYRNIMSENSILSNLELCS